MTSQNFQILGKNDEVRTRRYKILHLFLRNATPPEIAQITGADVAQVYRDISFLRGIELNDLPLEIIKDMGTNFFEMKVREYSGQVARIPEQERLKHSSYVLGLEDKIIKCKIESLKIQGVYAETENRPPGPITIIFEEVEAQHGKNYAEPDQDRTEEQAWPQDNEPEEGTAADYDGPAAASELEKEYPRY